MQPYVINAFQLLGLGCIAALTGALWTLLKFSDLKNFKAHSVFVSTVLSFLGLAVVFQSRLFVGRGLLDTFTWFSAMWFVYLLMYLAGFRLTIGHREEHGFGASSMLSFQHHDETLVAPTILDGLGDEGGVPHQSVESYIDNRGALVQGKRPTR